MHGHHWDLTNRISFLIVESLHLHDYCRFRIGFAIGIYLSSVIMNVIKGAVNTLIVCWADSPNRIQENHPELSQEMLDAWCSTFPQCGLYNPRRATLDGNGAQPPPRQERDPLQPQQAPSYGSTAMV